MKSTTRNMLIGFALAVGVLALLAAVPSQTDFDGTYFKTNTLPISLVGNLVNWQQRATNTFSSHWVDSGATDATLAGTATVKSNLWVDGADGLGGSPITVTNAAVTIRQKAGAHALVIDAGTDGGFDSLKIYGAVRGFGDTNRYITEFNGVDPGFASNGYILLNGDVGDPVPGTVAGETQFMLAIKPDIANVPVVVIQTVSSNGPAWRQYNPGGAKVLEFQNQGEIVLTPNVTNQPYVVTVTDVDKQAIFGINSQTRSVGIGTTNPVSAFEVTRRPDADPYAPVLMLRNQNTGGTFPKFQIRQDLAADTNGVTTIWNGNNATVGSYLPYSYNLVIGTNGTAIRFGKSLSEGSGDTSTFDSWLLLQAGNSTIAGTAFATHHRASSSGVFYWDGRGQLQANADGVFQFTKSSGSANAGLIVGSIQGALVKVLTSTTAADFLYVVVPNTNAIGGKVIYTVFATDGTDTQEISGDVKFAAVAKGTTVTAQLADVQTTAAVTGGSTLSAVLASNVTTNNVFALGVTATTSLTTTNLLIRWRLETPSSFTVNAL